MDFNFLNVSTYGKCFNAIFQIACKNVLVKMSELFLCEPVVYFKYSKIYKTQCNELCKFKI